MSEEIQRLLLNANEESCIVRCKTPPYWSVSARTSGDEITLDNHVLSVGSMFGCLAVSPFTNLVFDAGKISTSPVVTHRRGTRFYRHQTSVEQLNPSEMERTVLEDGSIEIIGDIRLNYQSDDRRREDPFPNSLDIQNRAASVVGREKNGNMDWLFSQNYHYRATYTFNEDEFPSGGSNYDYDSALPSHCRTLHNLRSFGTTRARRRTGSSSGHRRTLHETENVGQILSCILEHEHYSALEPFYNIEHHVTHNYMWFKGRARSVTIEIAITRILPTRRAPEDRLHFLEMNHLTSFPRKECDKTNWITNIRNSEGINLRDWNINLEDADQLGITQLAASLNLELEPNAEPEKMESLDNTHASLLSFAKVTPHGHIYLALPFDLEFDREHKMIRLPKGTYRVRIHGYCEWNLRLVHLVVAGLLRDVSFTPVSDRIQSIGELLERTGDPTILNQDDVENRLTTIDKSLSDNTVIDERYIE